jgi:hypothetical protein
MSHKGVAGSRGRSGSIDHVMDQVGPQQEREINMEAIVERSSLEPWASQSGRLAPIKNIVKRVFGCWHLKMGLPFTRGDETYRTCTSCGARRRFDLDQWTSVGGFYYPKKQSLLHGSRR